MIHVEHLSLSFAEDESKNILHDVSFDLDDGEMMMLLGPSGCGKSTLTYCLNGIYPRELDGQMKGTVTVLGKVVQDQKPGELSKHIGVVFQDPESQFCMLTVEDEIAFGLENLQIPRAHMEGKIEEVLQLVHLSDYKEATISSLSGGQKQKVALACVLALEPDILVLDEPTANLDPLATKEFINTIQWLQQQKQIGIIVIEHQLEGWASFIDRAHLLSKDGHTIFDGSLSKAIQLYGYKLQEQGISIPTVTQYALSAAKHQKRTYKRIPLTTEQFVSSVSYIDASIFQRKLKKGREQEQTILSASNLQFHKQGKSIIHDVDLTLKKQEFVAIVGANGSGKTTLSRLLAGIDSPTVGEITLHQRPLATWKEKQLRQEIGYVFQNPEHQFITDCVYDEIAYSLRIRCFQENDIQAQVNRILSYCKLEGLQHRHPYTLSQGQKRRLSVATMIVDDQQLLFLDEPTFGQDAASTRKIMDLLQERYENGTTVVMITHDMDLVDQYADRVIVVQSGGIVADESPIALWERPYLEQWFIEYPTRIQLQQKMEESYDDYATQST
ncbi:ABC transporter ATP-binding protein [Pontibacillus litoralis]|uniref:Cobalt ABC transporter n=1 Tax=Pontibacillus litoralis JSM 072002 TaxID=1385512 RepID=A0A0A5G7V9_9BACI|nr:ABC transporter ATP-binding protein [Pontibacillus litoralis]KGX87190.1 cobalt ABC transporter [Pontibacillus litoralis JSM 072002]